MLSWSCASKPCSAACDSDSSCAAKRRAKDRIRVSCFFIRRGNVMLFSLNVKTMMV